jgi:hypothetical protein
VREQGRWESRAGERAEQSRAESREQRAGHVRSIAEQSRAATRQGRAESRAEQVREQSK